MIDRPFSWLLLAQHRANATSFARRCQACQVNDNRFHGPTTQSITHWPFHTRAFDLISSVDPPSKGNIWILTATKYYTKWVEAVALKQATRAALANFIHDNIICQFNIQSESSPIMVLHSLTPMSIAG